MTPDRILSLKLRPNDAEAATIGDYLRLLLVGVWQEEEGFDGKRPFGNSGWQSDIYEALVDAKLIAGSKTIYHAGSEDEYTEYNDYDDAAGDKLIFECINYVFREYTY